MFPFNKKKNFSFLSTFSIPAVMQKHLQFQQRCGGSRHQHTKSGYDRLNSPVEKGAQNPGVNPHLHACTLRKAHPSKLLCVGELREASESAAASCSELKIPG